MPERKKKVIAAGEEEDIIARICSGAGKVKPEGASFLRNYLELSAAYERLFKKFLRQQRILTSMDAKLRNLGQEVVDRNLLIETTFGPYLSRNIVQAILQSPGGATIRCEKRIATILITDLRGFTPLSERLSAEGVVQILNNYLEVMTNIIFKYDGTIDEFMGDSIMVIFGAPFQRKDDTRRAVACALEMQLAMGAVNQCNTQAGYPEVEMGIGINTGEVIVGSIGSLKRMKYAVVGRVVNLTSRIESCSLGGQILISQSTCDACGNILDISNSLEVIPKGIEKPITIYEVRGLGEPFNLSLPENEGIILSAFPVPLPIQFMVISEFQTQNKAHAAEMVALSQRYAEVKTRVSLEPLSTLKISLFDHERRKIQPDLYAKVVNQVSTVPSVYRIHFTYLPQRTAKYLFTAFLNSDRASREKK